MKKPKYTDFIKEYDKNKPDAEYLYNKDLERYCEALNNYCEELNKQKTKVVDILVDIGCERCPKYTYCCKNQTFNKCRDVLLNYIENE